MNIEEKIEKALEILRDNDFDPLYPAYFVTKNGNDDGGSDQCINCIEEVVKDARRSHRGKRAEILEKYKEISETGSFKGIDVKSNHTEIEIKRSKRRELKEYPSRATFSYKGHDPDFGGGLHEPCSCEICGEYFQCSFTPDGEQARYMFEIVNGSEPLTDRDKWMVAIGIEHYEYVDDDVKQILDKLVNVILTLSTNDPM